MNCTCRFKSLKMAILFMVSVMLLMGNCRVVFSAQDSSVVMPINRIVAIVNNETITFDQLSTQVSFIAQQLRSAKQEVPPINVLQSQVLQQMIDDTLQLQIARKTGIRVTEAEVSQALNQIAKQNNQDLETIYKAIEQQGISISDYRKQIADQIVMQKLQTREVASGISISQQEVDNFIRDNLSQGKAMPEYQLAEILIALPAAPSSDDIDRAENRAADIVKLLKGGSSFKKLATSYSSGSTALQGGVLGWQKLAELPQVYAAILPKMKTGEISDPIRTVNGFSIIMLLAKRNAAVSTQSQKQEVEQLIFQRQFKEDLQAFISRLRGEAYIKILL